MSDVLYTSDPHLGHEKVSTIRGFGSTQEHDEKFIENWIKTVRKSDQVWVLGDIAVSNLDGALKIFADLPGEKHLISGNHDASHPMHRKFTGKVQRYLEVFKTVQPYACRKIDNQSVFLSHFPYNGEGGDRGDIRYPEWRLPDFGHWLLHGHTHMEDQRRHGKQIHVGLDAWDFTPVTTAQIIDLMREV